MLNLDGNSYVYVIVDAFTQYVVLHPSPKNDATNALTVLFDHLNCQIWNTRYFVN